MATPLLKLEAAQDAVFRVENKLREGYRPMGVAGATGPGAIDAAADQAITEGIIGSRAGFRKGLWNDRSPLDRNAPRRFSPVLGSNRRGDGPDAGVYGLRGGDLAGAVACLCGAVAA